MQQAKSQKIQKEAQEVLYCDTGWNEHEIYGQRFSRIVKRSGIDETVVVVDDEVAKEYGKRIRRKMTGSEKLDKSLLFYRVFETLTTGGKTEDALITLFDSHQPENIRKNLYYLDKCGFVEKNGVNYQLSIATRKLLLKAK